MERARSEATKAATSPTSDSVAARFNNLDADERRLWRRYERGLRVVQVGDAVRPLASGEYFNPDATRVLIEHLEYRYGDDFDNLHHRS